MYYHLFTTNTLSPTLSLKSPENFGKFTDREVPVFATFVKSLSEVAASKLSLLKGRSSSRFYQLKGGSFINFRIHQLTAPKLGSASRINSLTYSPLGTMSLDCTGMSYHIFFTK